MCDESGGVGICGCGEVVWGGRRLKAAIFQVEETV
jgi:hypothetical protein